MLFAAGTALLARLFFVNAWTALIASQNVQKSQRSYALGVVTSIIAAGFGLVGIVRLVKWAWGN
jgi:hypothetical protein